ncbi:hypothetical protein BRYFOR_09421 [Marvinbryantia formatexigens DSM 14469]|uniref:Uncharacterized protein n=1 Tax=Marvinbryantia formatexigens DSM 14469 TaxID=478749 RepID=C6LL74_9FIRM|nr:hypothetical protein BRYFOR_09421 [Marvinbryantia formatexigens DSM 14469]
MELLSEKNCANVIPKAEQIASRVEIDGTVFLRWIFAIVEEDKPDSTANL